MTIYMAVYEEHRVEGGVDTLSALFQAGLTELMANNELTFDDALRVERVDITEDQTTVTPLTWEELFMRVDA